MSLNTRVGSGQLFVRFVTVGLISLFGSVIFLKSSSIAGVYTAVILGLCIFVINLVAVLGYTFAVLKSPQVLAESDSPDLAYYLGFCLTVGALSATFITDTLLSQFASINSIGRDVAQLQTDLIKGSLIQFGVGLTATLIGLCAKIYLASKQSSESLEPEELYRNFRVEINTFEKEMRLITDSYTKTVEDSVSRLKTSVSDTCNSFDKLREVASKSNDLIASNISHDNITLPINEFIESIDGFKGISESLVAMKSSVESADESIKSMQSSTQELSNSTKSLLESNGSIKSSNQVLSADIAGFSATIKSASQNANEFLTSLKQVGDRISQTGQEFSELQGKAKNSFDGVAQFSERLSGLANSLVQLGNQLITLENLLIKNNSDLKLSNESNRTFISDIENFQNVVKKITSDLVTFESRLIRINNAN